MPLPLAAAKAAHEALPIAVRGSRGMYLNDVHDGVGDHEDGSQLGGGQAAGLMINLRPEQHQ